MWYIKACLYLKHMIDGIYLMFITNRQRNVSNADYDMLRLFYIFDGNIWLLSSVTHLYRYSMELV